MSSVHEPKLEGITSIFQGAFVNSNLLTYIVCQPMTGSKFSLTINCFLLHVQGVRRRNLLRLIHEWSA